MYAIRKIDPENLGCQQICELFKRKKSYRDILCYNGLYSAGNYIGLNEKGDSHLINNILSQISLLEAEYTHIQHQKVSLSIFWHKKSGNSMNNLQKNLMALGIALEPKTGHLFYANNFKPMELEFELVFVRHGETYGNCGQSTTTGEVDYSLVTSEKEGHEKRIYQGNYTEINQLTELGKQQALKAAEKLENQLLKNDWEPDVIFHSPLSKQKIQDYLL